METSTVELNDAAVRFFVDAEAPNWLSTDARGAGLLGQVDGKRTLGELRRRYAALHDLDSGKSWRDVQVFVREALRKGMLSLEPIHRSAYAGRAQHLEPESLKEFWIHLLQIGDAVLKISLNLNGVINSF